MTAGEVGPAYATLRMPPWFDQDDYPAVVEPELDRVSLVCDLAERNVVEKSGGPFASGVFEQASGKVVALGVNAVLANELSVAHAEVMAISLAQVRRGSWNLRSAPSSQLVVNWRPCIMCIGALLWAGISDVLLAGDGPELERIVGFDEGPVPPNWVDALAERGVTVTSNLFRDRSIATFERYVELGGVVYNVPPTRRTERMSRPGWMSPQYWSIDTGLCTTDKSFEDLHDAMANAIGHDAASWEIHNVLAQELSILDDKANALFQVTSLALAAVAIVLTTADGASPAAIAGCIVAVAVLSYSVFPLLRLNYVYWSTTDEFAAPRVLVVKLLHLREERTRTVRASWRRAVVALSLLATSAIAEVAGRAL